MSRAATSQQLERVQCRSAAGHEQLWSPSPSRQLPGASAQSQSKAGESRSSFNPTWDAGCSPSGRPCFKPSLALSRLVMVATACNSALKAAAAAPALPAGRRRCARPPAAPCAPSPPADPSPCCSCFHAEVLRVQKGTSSHVRRRAAGMAAVIEEDEVPAPDAGADSRGTVTQEDGLYMVSPA